MNRKTCRKCGVEKDADCFSKHSATADKLDNRCKDCVKDMKKKLRSQKTPSKTYEIYDFDMNSSEWQVGKPSGTILTVTSKYNTTHYEVRAALGAGKNKSKSFAFTEKTRDEMLENAKIWLRNYSDENGLTRNRIRKLDDNTIEVELTKNMTMLTDMQFLDLCQKYTLVATKGGNLYSEFYAGITINSNLESFHGYITGFPMVDHINRNPLDNRVENLRSTTIPENNRNKSDGKFTDKLFGLVFWRGITRQIWIVKIEHKGEKYLRTFCCNEHGPDYALALALEYREFLIEKLGIEIDRTFSEILIMD